jgi:hypothetical protein
LDSKAGILKELDMDFLVSFSYNTRLLRPNLYFTKQDFVKGLSRKLNIDQCTFISHLYKDGFNADAITNRFLTEINSNADIIKQLYARYLFFKEIKSLFNDIVFFEFKIGERRTDINRINSYSYAFEIKSGRDSPNRAVHQIKEFSDVFEFVILIVQNEEKYEDISDNIGIIKYEYNDGEMDFESIRKPSKNLELDSGKQLSSLSKMELSNTFNIQKGLERTNLIDKIMDTYSESKINTYFKNALKTKYFDSWRSYINRNIIDSQTLN